MFDHRFPGRAKHSLCLEPHLNTIKKTIKRRNQMNATCECDKSDCDVNDISLLHSTSRVSNPWAAAQIWANDQFVLDLLGLK